MDTKFDIKKYYPDMKLSMQSRGINTMSNNFSHGSDAYKITTQGTSIENLKKKYFGNIEIIGGPQKDNISKDSDTVFFTEDAIKVEKDSTSAVIIEPADTIADGEETIKIGKKTIITENGIPKASQG